MNDGGVADDFEKVDEEPEPLGRSFAPDPFEHPECRRVHQDQVGNGKGVADKVVQTDMAEPKGGQGAQPHGEAGPGSHEGAPPMPAVKRQGRVTFCIGCFSIM
jgi:hypothetical protein